jgi:hypothetical protein
MGGEGGGEGSYDLIACMASAHNRMKASDEFSTRCTLMDLMDGNRDEEVDRRIELEEVTL